MYLNKIISSIFLLILSLELGAQTTINFNQKNNTSANDKPVSSHKVLLIPFENKMYMSEIDHVINNHTNKLQKEIRWSFKDKIDEVLYRKFKTKYEVVSLVEDTLRNREELKMIYQGIGYRFDKIPDQKNYKPPQSDYKNEGKLKNGHIVATPNSTPRFMNAKIQDKSLLQRLNKKYKTDIFVFINQLDLKSSASKSDKFGAEKLRTATIHYTIFDLQEKEINSGVSECNFPRDENDPDKITTQYIEKAIEEIYQRVNKALNPVNSVITGK
jgi:hypothetical protein